MVRPVWVVVAVVAGVVVIAAPSALAAGELFTVAGTGRLGASPDGRLATTVALQPSGAVAVRPDGSVVIVDWPRVRVIELDGTIRTIAGRGRSGFSGDGGPAIEARMRSSDVAVASDGGILVAECGNQRVRRIAPDGTIATVAGSGPIERPLDEENFGGDGGPATSALLACAVAVDVLRDGGFVIDYDNGRVRRVAGSGLIATIAGRARVGGRRGDGGPATRAHLTPGGVAVAADGTVLVADPLDGRVRRVGLDGTISTVAGGGGLGCDGVAAVQAAMAPYGVAALPDGGFLVADAGGAASGEGAEPRVRRVDARGIVATAAGSGRFVPAPPRGNENRGDGGPARSADLLAVSDVAVASDGGVLIAEGWSFDDAKRP